MSRSAQPTSAARAATHVATLDAAGSETLCEQIACPDCGFVLTRQMPSYSLLYALNEWRRLCRRPELDEPVWCLVLRDGTEPRNGNP
jgi:hypothetical protein